jgi:hypothetical protein
MPMLYVPIRMGVIAEAGPEMVLIKSGFSFSRSLNLPLGFFRLPSSLLLS